MAFLPSSPLDGIALVTNGPTPQGRVWRCGIRQCTEGHTSEEAAYLHRIESLVRLCIPDDWARPR